MLSLKTVAKAGLISSIIFSFGCTSTAQVYVPVGCLGLPEFDIQFTKEEASLIPPTPIGDSFVDKIVLMRETYKARINAQCEINAEHDKLHEVKL